MNNDFRMWIKAFLFIRLPQFITTCAIPFIAYVTPNKYFDTLEGGIWLGGIFVTIPPVLLIAYAEVIKYLYFCKGKFSDLDEWLEERKY